MGFEPFRQGFSLFGILFFVMFGLFICMFVGVLISGLLRWNKNNHAPRLTVPATVVSKRTQVSHHHNGTVETAQMHSYTHYYATFQVESGDRMELSLDGREYGMLAQGDRGRLSFQGTRYLGFQRD